MPGALLIRTGAVPASTRGFWHNGAHLHCRFLGIDIYPTVVVAHFFYDADCYSICKYKGYLKGIFVSEQLEIAALKQDLRKRTLTARDQLRTFYREDCSKKLAGFLDLFGNVENKVISGYWPIRSEIDPLPLMWALKNKGGQLALPVVVNRTTIVFRAYDSDRTLIDAGFGTRGPDQGAKELQPDIMLIPLSVFDCHGGRIGYGAGHYDRAISKLHNKGLMPQKIGLAFALQEVPRVPQDKFDINLDKVLTHEGCIVSDKMNEG